MDPIAVPRTCPGHGRCSLSCSLVQMIASLRLALSAVLLAGLFATAACSSSSDDTEGASEGDAEGDDGSGDGDGGGSGGEGGGEPPLPPSANSCSLADECVAVSSICCECPTFAVPSDSPFANACDQVECEMPVDCPLVEAACVESQCQLICSTVEATMSCANGFERDTFGCLVDACRAEPGEFFSCEQDDDCIEAQGDCCGCELGGTSTAVAVDFLDQYIESLGCGPAPDCPGIDVCEAGLVARCVAQTCALGPPDEGGDDGDGSGGPGNFCGTPDLPACPKGQLCVLNHPDASDATRMGVGSCVDPDQLEPESRTPG
jgi:hypothetical protein